MSDLGKVLLLHCGNNWGEATRRYSSVAALNIGTYIDYPRVNHRLVTDYKLVRMSTARLQERTRTHLRLAKNSPTMILRAGSMLNTLANMPLGVLQVTRMIANQAPLLHVEILQETDHRLLAM